MAVLRMNSREFAAYQHRLASNFKAVLVRGVQAGAQRVVSYLIDRTRQAPPANPAGVGEGGAVNTGEFVRRWKARPLSDGAVVTNDYGPGPTIEHGRRPGRAPPREALIVWAIRRLGLSREEAEAAVYPIQQAIKRRGLIGRKILTAPEAQARIEHIVREEIIHEIQRDLAKKR